MVAIPETKTRNISDLFIVGRYRLVINGASDIPKNIFPAVVRPSAPDIFKERLSSHATPLNHKLYNPQIIEKTGQCGEEYQRWEDLKREDAAHLIHIYK